MTDRCRSCDAELPPPAPTGGQRRHYCGTACRSAAYRRRRATRALFVGDALEAPGLLPNAALEKLVDYVFVRDDEPYSAAVEIVVTLQAVAKRCRHLATDAPAQLGWRHERTAEAADAILADLWALD